MPAHGRAHVYVYVCILYRGISSYHSHHDLLCEMELLTHKYIFIFILNFLDVDGLFFAAQTQEATDSLRSLCFMYKFNGFTLNLSFNSSFLDEKKLSAMF